jgi:hypothetical protein
MRYYIIYSADWLPVDYNGHPNRMTHYAPPESFGLELTEGGDDDNESEYGYLCEDDAAKRAAEYNGRGYAAWQDFADKRYSRGTYDNSAQWAFAEHGKWAGILTGAQLSELCDEQGLTAEDCETGGSLTGIGWLPAVSFHSDDPSAIVSAYVTPIPEDDARPFTEDDWQSLRDAIVSAYSDPSNIYRRARLGR